MTAQDVVIITRFVQLMGGLKSEQAKRTFEQTYKDKCMVWGVEPLLDNMTEVNNAKRMVSAAIDEVTQLIRSVEGSLHRANNACEWCDEEEAKQIIPNS